MTFELGKNGITTLYLNDTSLLTWLWNEIKEPGREREIERERGGEKQTVTSGVAWYIAELLRKPSAQRSTPSQNKICQPDSQKLTAN